MHISEIAAPTTRHKDFTADTLGMIQHCHTAATLACLGGAKQTCGTRSQYDDIYLFQSCVGPVLNRRRIITEQ
jgi:hypothetical protein